MIIIFFPRLFGRLGFVVLLPFFAILFLGAVVGCIASIDYEYSREVSFQHRYGDNWKAEYEQIVGPLSTAHARMAVAAIGVIAMIATAAWLIKVLMDETGLKRRSSRASRHRDRNVSPIERVTRYRRNALLGHYFGVPGILLSILLTLFHVGIFADHADETVLAILIFVGSYCTVISGCYWSVKAKGWHDAVIFIAIMPLTVFLVPSARLFVLASPQLLIAAMLMMSFILIVVVAVLPDKSGTGRRRARAPWEHRRN